MSRLISELPENIRKIAMQYQHKDGEDALIYSFSWGKTKEGHDIWNAVYRNNYQPFYDFYSTKQKLTPKEWCKEKGYNEYHVMIIEQYLNDAQ